jgi:predicted unusual protein kinase regulating ubiquinone biosynthesis (AarF/ABC1/UbiB family)
MTAREDARAAALAEQLGAQLGRMKGAGPKLIQLLSMVELDPASGRPPGALPDTAEPVPFSRARKTIEQDLEARVRDLFDDIDEEPFALASLGQVHRATTTDGDHVAVKVQHPGIAEAAEADLRNLGLVAPILKQLAPALDTRGLLAELRERAAEELDYELEAQHHRRIERLARHDPDVRIPRVHTALCGRRVLVTDFVEGRRGDDLAEQERDRAGEIAFRFYLGLAWREGIVAADPHADNCLVCPDGRVCLLDFGLMRTLDAAFVAGEREVMRALAAGDPVAVHAGLERLGYLPDPGAVEPDAVTEFLSAAGEWLLAPGFRRLDPEQVAGLLELGYPPRSPFFPLMRRLALPPHALLLRRLEIQLAALLGDLHAGADWGAITAEHHSGRPPATALGRRRQAHRETSLSRQ